MADTRKTERRSNEERSRRTREALINAARGLFVDKGFAQTSTPDIVRAANVTRGALYHHFDDKKALLSAVVYEEAVAVADQIRAHAGQPQSALEALLDGSRGYFAAMSVPGRARLLLVEGPSILGADHVARLNHETSTMTLEQGLLRAIPAAGDDESELPVKELAQILGAGFDAAALSIAQGGSADRFEAALALVFRQLLGPRVNL